MGRNLMGLALLAVVAGVTVPLVQAEDAGLASKIQAATTAADHDALATQYEQEAAEAKAKAAQHRAMATAYKGSPAISGGKVSGASTMPQHCEAIAKSFDEQAKMFTEMAATERALAKQ